MRTAMGVLALLVSSAVCGAQEAAVAAPTRYVVDVRDAGTQVIGVEMTVATRGAAEVEFVLPTWRSGRYVILDFAATVRDVEALSGDGGSLDVEKTSKASWAVETDGAETVTLSYGVFADSRDDRTRYLDTTHCFFDASAVLMYVPTLRPEEHRIAVRAPGRWDVVSGLEKIDQSVWLSPDYDTLADSPFEMGELEIYRFESFDVPHTITVWGEADYDAEQMIADFKALTDAQIAMFGEVPYDSYVFMVHIYPGGGGGTEHVNSTIVQAEPGDFESERGYAGFLGLVSHEIFHTWNVKAFRPAGITPYDFTRENYTPSLWIVEGTTSYYDDLFVARTGLMSPSMYMERIAGGVERTRGRFARFRQSLAASSWDAWIHFFALQRHADRPNAMVNFYGRGALASLCLDMRIRELTNNTRSLDDVMRAMYEEFPLEDGGYTPEDFRTVVSRIAGEELSAWFERYIDGTGGGDARLPIEDALRFVGLSLRFDRDETPLLGVFTRVLGDGRVVTGIDESSPAFGKGLVAGDRLVSIDTRRVTDGALATILDNYEPGDTVKVLYFRHDRLRTVDITLARSPYGEYTIDVVDAPSASQREAFEDWAGFPLSELEQ